MFEKVTSVLSSRLALRAGTEHCPQAFPFLCLAPCVQQGAGTRVVDLPLLSDTAQVSLLVCLHLPGLSSLLLPHRFAQMKSEARLPAAW